MRQSNRRCSHVPAGPTKGIRMTESLAPARPADADATDDAALADGADPIG